MLFEFAFLTFVRLIAFVTPACALQNSERQYYLKHDIC